VITSGPNDVGKLVLRQPAIYIGTVIFSIHAPDAVPAHSANSSINHPPRHNHRVRNLRKPKTAL
jgi:hypothetical protein